MRKAAILTGADPNSDRADERDGWVQVEEVGASLDRLGYAVETLAVGLDLRPVAALKSKNYGIIVNLVEAIGGEGSLIHLVPSVLEAEGLSFTGSSARTIYVTTNKCLTKELLRAADLPTPDWSRDGLDFDDSVRLILKSVTEDASYGLDVSSVVTGAKAESALRARRSLYGGDWFAEVFIEGREFNLSLLEIDGKPTVLPLAEIEFRNFPRHRPKLVDYEAKWDVGSHAYQNTVRVFPCLKSNQDLLDLLKSLALRCWDLFQLSGYARVDFRVDGQGQPWILEINANPCLSSDAGFAAASAEAGYSYDALIWQIVENARTRQTYAA